MKDAGADERAAVDARLASLAAAMRLDDAQLATSDGPSSAGTPPAPRAEVRVQTDSGDGAGRGSSLGADVDETDAGHPSSASEMPTKMPEGLADSYEVPPSLERAINATMERALAAYSERLIETVRSSVAASATSRG